MDLYINNNKFALNFISIVEKNIEIIISNTKERERVIKIFENIENNVLLNDINEKNRNKIDLLLKRLNDNLNNKNVIKKKKKI